MVWNESKEKKYIQFAILHRLFLLFSILADIK